MTNKLQMIRRMRISNTTKLAALCIAMGVAAACSTTEAPGPIEPNGAVGRVRLVNLITDATRGRVNVALEGQVFTVDLLYAQAAPANLPSPATATYSPVYTGNRSFVLKRTADTTVTVTTINFAITDGQDMTVYAIGGVGGSAITSFNTTDDNTAATSAETRVRIVNMSPTAGAVDVFITAIGADLSTATPRATNLAYKQASAYLSITPGAYQIRAVPAGTAPANRAGAVTISLASNASPAPPAFAGGTGRTVVLADNSTGGSPLRAIVIADR
jgi:hypothetical protein